MLSNNNILVDAGIIDQGVNVQQQNNNNINR